MSTASTHVGLDLPDFKYPDECTIILIADIDTSDRIRGINAYGEVQELADSISQLGLIHPPTLTRTGNKLIAGGRRVRAMTLLGKTCPVVYREEMDQHLISELELEENIKRLNMKWQEKVLGIHRMHKHKVREGILMREDWKQAETGQLLGVSAGHVSHALFIAELIIKDDVEIIEADSLQKAWAVVLGRREQEAMKKIAQSSGLTPTARTSGDIIVDLSGNTVSQTVGDQGEVEFTEVKVDPNIPITPTNEHYTVDLGNMFKLGDCLRLMAEMEPKSFDHIVTDIPYGIDMANLDTHKHVDRIASTHDVSQNLSMMPEFLRQAHRVVKDSGYVVFWYDLDHHEKLHTWAEEAGFNAQSWPLIWVKAHACRNNAATKNFTKSTEYAMVLRRSTSSNLVEVSHKNYVIADGTPERKLYDNPFAKPFEVWRFILKHIAFKGQTVLDPFSGQMSCPRACINLGMKPTGLELDPHHFFNGVQMIKDLYNEMTQGKVTFANDPIKGMSFEQEEVLIGGVKSEKEEEKKEKSTE
jgi:DNA modification methylase